MSLITLVRLFTVRHLFLEKTRSLLTIFGITLGVSLLVAIRIANISVLHSFRESLDAVSGRTTLEITGGELGVDETLITLVRREKGIRSLSPVIQTPALVKGSGEVLIIMGVDLLVENDFRTYSTGDLPEGADPLELLMEPDALFLSREFAERYHYSIGSRLPLLVDTRVREGVVRGILDGSTKAFGGNFAIMDIAAAQLFFNKIGRLDRIDLITDPNIPLPRIIERLKVLLPPHLTIAPPERRNTQVLTMLRSFQLNLTALSALSLFVGMFLIYNTVSYAVVRRRREIGILRILGVSCREILLLFTVESLIIGLIGSLLGVLMGMSLAQIALRSVSRTVTSLYLLAEIRKITVPPSLLVEGVLIGVLVSLVAALHPAREASRVVPQEALHRGGWEEKRRKGWKRSSAAGILLLSISSLLSFLFSEQGRVGQFPIFGFLSAFCLLLGSVLLVPGALLFFSESLSRLIRTRSWAETKVATNGLVSSLGRTSVACASLLIGVGMMVGMVILIHSFRTTLSIWIDQTITADLIIAPMSLYMGAEGTMPERVAREIEQVKGIEAVDRYRGIRIEHGEGQFHLGSRDLEIHNRHSRFIFFEGKSEEILTKARKKGEALVSEGFSRRYGVQKGGHLSLMTPSGPVDFPIAGVFYDYSADGGRVILDREVYTRYWRDHSINVLAVYLTKEAHREEVRQALVSLLGEKEQLAIIPNREFKEEILGIFDQTFSITYALEFITLTISLLGIANTLLAQIVERKREIGILRVIGASRRQIQKIILYEACGIGTVGTFLGTLSGFFLSLILIFVINRQSFGWTIQFYLPVRAILQSFGLLSLTSLLAGFFPARRAVRIQIAEALRYE